MKKRFEFTATGKAKTFAWYLLVSMHPTAIVSNVFRTAYGTWAIDVSCDSPIADHIMGDIAAKYDSIKADSK